MNQVLLFDVEGTTTDIAFVHQTLFPYSRERMATFVKSHGDLPVVQKLTAQYGSIDQVVKTLLGWIQNDKKESALKELQGLIWDEGYRHGDFKGHVYPDVRPAFEQWKKSGKTLAIYSSGSVHAQKCIFGFSTDGDLTPLISNYFDTAVGAKRESESYHEIARQLGVTTSAITFYSDIKEELDAARAAGMQTRQVFRSGNSQNQGHISVETFANEAKS